MKTIWKNMLGAIVIAAISSGVAIGASTYYMSQNQATTTFSSGVENTFKQPYKLAGYNAVAAENTDFTYAAEKAVHGVVHIKATQNS